MLKTFLRYIEDNNLVVNGEKIIVAVSGGIDSMTMADLFHEAHFDIAIAHCNFSLRGVESDKDEELVKKYAEANNIPFFTTSFKTKSYAHSKHLSVQMAARELRYDWFEKIRSENNYDKIAVAHNLNDNAETLLINLVRGTGLAGMSGIRPLNNNIIRPLLFASREEIEKYSKENNIAYHEDSSNSDTGYTRNKIRHLVIPVFREINPSVLQTLNETAERFTGLNEIVNSHVSEIRASLIDEKENYLLYNIPALKKLKKNRTLIFELFRIYGVTNSILPDLLKIIDGKTGGQVLTETHRIIKNRKDLIVSGLLQNNDQVITITNEEEFIKFSAVQSVKKISTGDSFEIPSDPHIACLDYSKLSYPVTIRKWMAGDYFYPLGMKQKKKLSDYFIDRKYSIIDKENIYVMESGGKIFWIIGDRIDNRFRISSSTDTALIIKTRKKAMVIKPIR